MALKALAALTRSPRASKTGSVGGWLIHHATFSGRGSAARCTPLHREEGLRGATLTVKGQKWIPLIRGHMAIVTVAQFAWWKKQCAAVLVLHTSPEAVEGSRGSRKRLMDDTERSLPNQATPYSSSRQPLSFVRLLWR